MTAFENDVRHLAALLRDADDDGLVARNPATSDRYDDLAMAILTADDEALEDDLRVLVQDDAMDDLEAFYESGRAGEIEITYDVDVDVDGDAVRQTVQLLVEYRSPEHQHAAAEDAYDDALIEGL